MAVSGTGVKEKLWNSGVTPDDMMTDTDNTVNGFSDNLSQNLVKNGGIHHQVEYMASHNTNVCSKTIVSSQEKLNAVVENLITFSPDPSSQTAVQCTSTQNRQRLASVDSSLYEGSEKTLSPREDCFSSSDERSTDTLDDIDNIHVQTGNVFPTASNGCVLRPDSLSLPKPMRDEKDDKREIDSQVKQTVKSPHERDHHRSSSLAMAIPLREKDNLEENLSKSLPQGVILKKGDLIEFVADDLQEKIRRSSPMARTDSSGLSSRTSSIRSLTSMTSATSSTSSAMMTSGLSRSPSSILQQSPDDIPPIDPQAVIELENHARHVADSLDLLMGNLRSNLHKMSGISVGNEQAYSKSVDMTCESVDNGIKSMYALMAKCEELGKTMAPIYELADQIKEIKRLLDRFEAQVTSKV